MSFTAPKFTSTGRIIRPDELTKAPLGDGQRCLICFETDPTKYNACQEADCYPVGPFKPESEPSPFTAPKPLVSAFALARRMRAKALSLDWDEDEQRSRLLARARELEKGDRDEVPEEDF